MFKKLLFAFVISIGGLTNSFADESDVALFALGTASTVVGFSLIPNTIEDYPNVFMSATLEDALKANTPLDRDLAIQLRGAQVRYAERVNGVLVNRVQRLRTMADVEAFDNLRLNSINSLRIQGVRNSALVFKRRSGIALVLVGGAAIATSLYDPVSSPVSDEEIGFEDVEVSQ